MKNKIIICCLCYLLVSITNLSATILIVQPEGIGGYTTFATAYTAANAGDTLMVYGAYTNYGDITITKNITIIGEGYYNLNGTSKNTRFGNVLINNASATLIGLEIDYLTTNISTQAATTTLRYCKVLSSIKQTNIAGVPVAGGTLDIQFCIISALQHPANYSIYYEELGSASNSIRKLYLRNNLMLGSCYAVRHTNNTGPNIIVIDHNIFKINAVSNTLYLPSPINILAPSVVSNNIFDGGNFNTAAISTYDNLPFLNNCFNNTSNNVYGINSINGNPNFINPIFSYIIHNNTSNVQRYSDSSNFNVQPNSICLGAGIDGVDLGPYGGVYGTQFNITGYNAFTQMKSLTMPTSVISGNTIQVSIMATTK